MRLTTIALGRLATHCLHHCALAPVIRPLLDPAPLLLQRQEFQALQFKPQRLRLDQQIARRRSTCRPFELARGAGLEDQDSARPERRHSWAIHPMHNASRVIQH